MHHSYSQSRMQPPFWIVKRDREHIAEVWKEEVAKELCAALNQRQAVGTEAQALVDLFVWQSAEGREGDGDQPHLDRHIPDFNDQLTRLRDALRREG